MQTNSFWCKAALLGWGAGGTEQFCLHLHSHFNIPLLFFILFFILFLTGHIICLVFLIMSKIKSSTWFYIRIFLKIYPFYILSNVSLWQRSHQGGPTRDCPFLPDPELSRELCTFPGAGRRAVAHELRGSRTLSAPRRVPVPHPRVDRWLPFDILSKSWGVQWCLERHNLLVSFMKVSFIYNKSHRFLWWVSTNV